MLKRTDEERYTRLSRDVKNFCEALNLCVENLKAEGLAVETPSEEAIRGLCVYNSEGLKKDLKAFFEAQNAGNSPIFARASSGQHEQFYQDLENHVFAFKSRLMEARGDLGLCLFERDRLAFISVKEGRAFPNETAISESCNIVMDNPFVDKLIKEAKAMHKAICVWDARIRKATNGKMGFLGFAGEGAHIIEVYDGKIDLALDRLIDRADEFKEIQDGEMGEAVELDRKKYFVTEANGRKKPL